MNSKEAVLLADTLEKEAWVSLEKFNYVENLKIALKVAERIKDVIPMYIGELNPKWKIYDEAIKILKRRII